MRLADEGHKIAEAYGVWVEKSMYGKKYMGVERSNVRHRRTREAGCDLSQHPGVSSFG
jgi:hypothetical protein